MRFSDEYKRKAVELYQEWEMKDVFIKLDNQFKGKQHPNERTITRWKKIFKELSGSNAKSSHTLVEDSTLFITQEGLYKKHVGPIAWLGNAYVLKKILKESTNTPPKPSDS